MKKRTIIFGIGVLIISLVFVIPNMLVILNNKCVEFNFREIYYNESMSSKLDLIQDSNKCPINEIITIRPYFSRLE